MREVVPYVAGAVIKDFLLVEARKVLVVSVDEVQFNSEGGQKLLLLVQEGLVVVPDPEITDLEDGIDLKFLGLADDLFGLRKGAVPITGKEDFVLGFSKNYLLLPKK